MKLPTIPFVLFFGALAAAMFLGTKAVAADRPNVIFFLSDDQRADFLGCAGHPILQTPTIDKLAAAGVRFENAFVTTSICAASRATIFTCQWERTHGFTFGTPPIPEPASDNSYPAVLRRAGYRTGFVGKFGVAVPQGAREKMFDVFVPLNRSPYFKKQPDGSLRHVTEIAGDRAVEFLRGCEADRPFCLSVSFNAAHAEDGDKVNHYPWPKAVDGLYEDVTIPPPKVSIDFWKQLPPFFHDSMHRDRWFWRWDTPEKYQKNVKAYYRMITGLDRVMGRVLDELDQLGRAENTVVIFCGDNGYYKGSRGFAGKWSHFEESLRVPLVIYDPRLPQDQRGRVLKPMALNVDVPATIVDLAGLPLPATYQGRSLMPLVRGRQPDDWRTDFFCEHLMNNAKIPKYEGVRGERYVYARYFEHPDDGEFLHDLEVDPDQLKNFVADPAYREVLDRMRARCNELRDELGGPYRPREKP
ncbi:MAG TPA: sulfatase [Thermoguttaceae bacterium]|nr:sulfatase [Thermoguttaceae bacterium]